VDRGRRGGQEPVNELVNTLLKKDIELIEAGE
jgi:hypothetical protein